MLTQVSLADRDSRLADMSVLKLGGVVFGKGSWQRLHVHDLDGDIARLRSQWRPKRMHSHDLKPIS